MSDKFKDIEKLFQDSFEGFEADVDPSVWSDISSQIGNAAPNADPSSAVSGSSSGSGGILGSTAAKIAAVTGTVAVVSTSAYFGLRDTDSEVSLKEENVTEQVISTEPENEFTASSNEIKVDITQMDSEIPSEDAESSTISDQTTLKEETVAQNSEEMPQNFKSENTLPVNDSQEEQVDSEQAPISQDDIVVIDDKEEERQEIEVEPEVLFEPSIYPSVNQGETPLTVTFENRGNHSEDVVWKFRDGDEVYDEKLVEHTFEKSGQYWVILEVKDETGKVHKDSALISVKGKTYINAENVFSPNNDGINDAFTIETEGVKNLKCQVLDRSGRMIYQWSGLNGQWDGRDLSGAPVPRGTYFFIIEATDKDGEMIEPVRGTVTLFRK